MDNILFNKFKLRIDFVLGIVKNLFFFLNFYWKE